MLDELNAPGAYIRATSAAKAPLASALVKDLPFRYAPLAITISLDELEHRVPAIIKSPSFDKECTTNSSRSFVPYAIDSSLGTTHRWRSGLRSLRIPSGRPSSSPA